MWQPVRAPLAHCTHVITTQRRPALRVGLGRCRQAILVDGHAQAGPIPQLDAAVLNWKISVSRTTSDAAFHG